MHSQERSMSLRNVWRRMHRGFSAFAVPDHSVARPGGRLVLFSCHDADRSMTEGGGRFSPLLEGIRCIMADLGCVSVNLTHPFAIFKGSDIKDGSITVNHRVLPHRLRTRLQSLVSPSRAKEMSLDLETKLYRIVLETLRPEMVISIQPPYGLCRAARQMGIMIVEAMHGTNYNMNDKIFGAHMKNPDILLPNILLSFDDVSHATMTALTAGRDIEALRANDPWLHSLRLEQSRTVDRMLPIKAGDDRRNQVLVTLQWGYDGERKSLSNIIPNGILHPALEAAFAKTADRFRFLVRMHPIQMNKHGYRHHRRYIQSLPARYPNVEWERATAWPLPLLLDEVCAHVTMSSSSVGEAAAANVPSLTLCPTLHPGGALHGTFRELEAEGHLTFGKLDTEAIIAWIEASAIRIRERPPYDAEQRHGEELVFYAALLERTRSARTGGTQRSHARNTP